MGGLPFSRGALFHLLRNPIYRGQIRHKGNVYPGEHNAIVEEDLFNQVRDRLDANARRHRAAPERRTRRSPLTGKLFDAAGEPMTPSFSRGSKGKLYRYYVSASLQQGGPCPDDGSLRRVAANAIEDMLASLLHRWSGAFGLTLADISSVHLEAERILIDLPAGHGAQLSSKLDDGEQTLFANKTTMRIEVPVSFPLRGGQRQVIAGTQFPTRPDSALIAALRKAHRMLRTEKGMPVIDIAPDSNYDRKILRLAFLAPNLQRGILAGRQPTKLNLEQLRGIEIPLDWDEQREALGWGH